MKKLVVICVIAAMTSLVYALPADDFNDNSADTSLWDLYQLDSTVWADETNQRLEFRSTGDGDGGAAGYFANGWGLSPTHDFSLKVDFHFFSLPSGLANTDSAIQFALNMGWNNDIIIETGCGSNEEGTAYHSFFYCAIENRDDDSEYIKGEKERYTDDGTLYISYDANEDKLYLSDIGYWAANAWITVPNLINGTWAGNALFLSFGGWSEGIVLGSGDAYLDNFVVDSGTIVPICEYPLAGDLNNDCNTDFEDLAILANQWLQTPGTPSADIAPSPNGDGIVNFQDFAAMTKDWLPEETTTPPDIVWVSINDSGAGMKDYYGNPISHGGFIGQMSKYETTNAQYCQFLNAALASGDITVGVDNIVYGASGSNSGEIYFDLSYDPDNGKYSQITYSGGVFSVLTRDGYDMSNHPVTSVSWYGATAFCNYYGYRLPSEWEWQAVADYDGSYTYGCGTTIDHSKANYYPYVNPLGLTSYPYTTPVDYYPSYGYGMNDMAGNVVEWTDSIYSGSYRVIRGGSWDGTVKYFTVSYCYPGLSLSSMGFRVCR